MARGGRPGTGHRPSASRECALSTLAAYLGLFVSALVSASVIPGSSEVVLVALAAGGRHPVAGLLAVATIGNICGSALNWMVGRGIERFRTKRWFPVSPDRLKRAEAWYHRWGRWSLLLSWVPLAGDALTVMAGVMREPLWSFVLLVGIAKGARYAVLLAGAFAVLNAA